MGNDIDSPAKEIVWQEKLTMNIGILWKIWKTYVDDMDMENTKECWNYGDMGIFQLSGD